MKMKKIKEIIKPVHIVYFIAVLVIVSIMQTNYGDDIGIKDGVKQYSNVISWVIFRYNSWSPLFAGSHRIFPAALHVSLENLSYHYFVYDAFHDGKDCGL